MSVVQKYIQENKLHQSSRFRLFATPPAWPRPPGRDYRARDTPPSAVMAGLIKWSERTKLLSAHHNQHLILPPSSCFILQGRHPHNQHVPGAGALPGSHLKRVFSMQLFSSQISNQFCSHSASSRHNSNLSGCTATPRGQMCA